MRGWQLDRRRWAIVRRQALERDAYRCVKCGRPGRLEVDHKHPLHLGGDPWRLDGLQTLCRGCHLAKTRRERGTLAPPGNDEWRERIASHLGERIGESHGAGSSR